jgi:hypothetical protein
MTWSYSGDPSVSTVDAVRFLVGDTDHADQQMSNEEIAWLVSEAGNATAAAILACDNLVAKYARQTDKTAGELSVKSSQRQAHYAGLAKRLRQRVATRNAVPFAGGISRTSKDGYEDNEDRVDPAFRRNLHRNPSTLRDDEENYE